MLLHPCHCEGGTQLVPTQAGTCLRSYSVSEPVEATEGQSVHFTNEEAEAQRSPGSHIRSPSIQWKSQGVNPAPLPPSPFLRYRACPSPDWVMTVCTVGRNWMEDTESQMMSSRSSLSDNHYGNKWQRQTGALKSGVKLFLFQTSHFTRGRWCVLLRCNSNWTALEAGTILCFISRAMDASCHPSFKNHAPCHRDNLQAPQMSLLLWLPDRALPRKAWHSHSQSTFLSQSLGMLTLQGILETIGSNIFVFQTKSHFILTQL